MYSYIYIYTGDHKSTGLAATYIWVKWDDPVKSWRRRRLQGWKKTCCSDFA